MSHARQHAGRARVLRAALVGVCVSAAGTWTEVAAAPARGRTQPRAQRIVVPLEVVAESERDGPLTEVRVSAQRIDEPGPTLEVAVVGGVGGIELGPGVWSLIARAPGRVDRQQVFTLTAPTREAPAAAPVRFTLPLLRVPVVLQLGPPEAIAAGATWTLARDGSEWGEMFPGERAREELSLQPGRWHGSVAAPGFVTQEFAWTIGEASPVIVLQRVAPAPVAARPPPPAPRGPDPRLGLGLGLGVAGAASLGLGLGLMLQHRQGYAHFDGAPNNAAFVSALDASSAGAGLIGSGLGLGVAGLTAGWTVAGAPEKTAGKASRGAPAGRRREVRDRVFWAELAVGGGLALIGAAWYARTWQDVQKDLYDADKDSDMDGTPNGHDPKAQRRETVAASVIGAGTGLMIGAGVALLTRTVLRIRGRADGGAARWGLAGGPGQVGLGLRGRF